MIHSPPDSIAPEVLFRLLLRTPRPSLPVAISLPGVSGGAFYVRAICGPELLAAQDAAGGELEQLKKSRVAAAVISLALHDEGGPVFRSPAEVGELDSDDYTILASAVLPAAQSISPMYGISDVEAWSAKLLEGARHPSNQLSAGALGSCCDRRTLITAKSRVTCYTQIVTDRPDRYFGLPLGKLTDGHWLCYRAARRIIEAR